MRAMILAAGRGMRMRPLTDHTPKPLLCAGGKPLIVWQIERLAAAGLRNIVINLAWLGDRIIAALGDGSRYGVRLHYSIESTALETAGGIAHALPQLGNAPFLVINGDIWCDWDAAQAHTAAQCMQQHDLRAWLWLVDNPTHHPQGDFYLTACARVQPHTADAAHPADGQAAITPPSEGSKRLTFSGIGLYHPALFANIPIGHAAKLAPVLRQAMQQGRVGGQYYRGTWVDVGTPQRLHALNAQLA